MVKTLDEFKAELAAEDAVKDAEQEENALETTDESESTQETEETIETDEAEIESDEEGEGREPDPDKSDENEADDWLKGDDHESQAEKKFTDGDIGKVKSKLKTKLDKRHNSELEKLQAEIAQLRSGTQTPVTNLQKPKREDFYESDDPDEAYDSALIDYVSETAQAKVNASSESAKRKRLEVEQDLKISQGEDEHYSRAAELVSKSGITAEKYQAADSNFKQILEDMLPNNGDKVAAALVARLGAGSEKVVYNIGVNSAKQEKLKELLTNDSSGLDAYGYLVELKMELNSPVRRKTNAPKPAPSTKGNAVTSNTDKLLKKAEASGNIQEQVNVRRKIRLAGRK